MKNYFIGYNKNTGIRHHPWLTAMKDETERYYDFRRQPELIRTVLEDYLPMAHYEAVRSFYSLLEWLNGEDSPFETNDCGLRPVTDNNQPELTAKRLVISGRLMVFFRELDRNVSPESAAAFNRTGSFLTHRPDFQSSDSTEWLVRRSLEEFDRLFPERQEACIGIELMPTLFEQATESRPEEKLGYELNYRFWAWGDDENEVMVNLSIVVEALHLTFAQLSTELPALCFAVYQ